MKRLTVTIPGAPVPASRPRVTRNGTYNAPRYKQWLSDASWWLRAGAIDQLGAVPMWTEPVSVTLTFCGARKNADIDNLQKGVFDAMQQAGVIVDDKQVIRVAAWKVEGKPQSTTVTVEVVE